MPPSRYSPPDTARRQAPRYDPTVPLADTLASPALAKADDQYSDGVEIGLGRVGGGFASRDVRKFKALLTGAPYHGRSGYYSGSVRQTGTELFGRLNALLDAGLGEMMSADALAWQCALLAVPPPEGTDPVDMIARWEKYTNHGWLAHVAGFSIAEVEGAGRAPGDQTVRMMLALRGGRTVLPKVRTPERLGPPNLSDCP